MDNIDTFKLDVTNKNDLNALDEINKGCSMGVDAINYILDKVEDSNFSDFLKKQLDDYNNISNKIEKIYNKYIELDNIISLCYNIKHRKHIKSIDFIKFDYKTLTGGI